MATFKIRVNGQETEIEATRRGDKFRVSYGEKTAELRLLYANGSSFVLEQELPDGTRRRIRIVGHMDGDSRQLWVNGRAFTYERVHKRGRNSNHNHSNVLSASIPAVVSEVLVKVGDMVSVGDKLILLESMKMVMPIQTPCDGEIIEINCVAGDAVQPGVQLIHINECEG